MRIPKSYGNYKKTICPFCERTATHKNEQGLDVCHLHLKKRLDEFKCLCGSWVELRVGKFGPYFNCIKCGNFNYNKGMEIKSATEKKFGKVEVEKKPAIKKEHKPKEISITTNDVEYFS